MKQNTRSPPNNYIQSFFTDPTLQRSFKGHKDTISSCVFNPNMKQVISAGDDTNVIVWNFKPQMRPYKFIGHKGTVNDLAITQDGSLIASASSDETVRLWNNSVTGKSQIIKAHTAPVKSVDFNSDGRLLLTGSDDKIMKIINVNDRKFLASLVGHTNWVRCARFSPDSRLVGSCSDDHTVKLWDVAQKTTIHTFIDHLEDVNVVKFHPDGTLIGSGSVDKKIKIWDIRSKRLIQHYDAHSASVTGISFHPSGNYLISSSMDSTLKVWDLKMGQILYTLYGHEGPATCINFSNCGDFFASGGSDAILMVWKSNVKNMDEENESLTKSEMSRLKSNTRKVEEAEIKVAYTKTIGKKTPKFSVTAEKPSVPNHQLSSTAKSQSLNSSNIFNRLPTELSTTFEKMIQQLDIIATTMKIMDQRIKTVENQISDLYQMKQSARNYDTENLMGTKTFKNNEMFKEVEENNYQKNDFRMSQNSSKYEEEMDYNKNEDNFQHQNVFNQNLGGTLGYYNNNEEEFLKQSGEHIRTNPVEIFEDVSNHVEEFNQELEDGIEMTENNPDQNY